MMANTPDAKRRARMSKGIVYMLSAVGALTFVFMIVIAFASVEYATTVIDPIIEYEAEMRYEVLNAHLMLEKVLAKDEIAHVDSVWNHYAAARTLIDKIKILAKKDWLKSAAGRSDIVFIEQTLDELYGLTHELQTLSAQGESVDTLDRRYNNLLDSFRDSAIAWETSLKSTMVGHLRAFVYLQILLLLVFIMAVVGVGSVIRRVTRERGEAVVALQRSVNEVTETCQKLASSEQQLKAANQQLHANEQQLRAANQQLHANEQQLRAANQQLRANEQLLRIYQKAVEHAEDLIAAVNSSFEYVFVNTAYECYFKADRGDLAHKTVKDIMGAGDFEGRIKPYLDRCLAGERVQYETKRTFEGRGERSLVVHFYPLMGKQPADTVIIMVLRDVTEQRRIDAEREKVERLESLGLLAGGIAHDFNNLLAGFFGHVSLARSSLTDDSPIAQYLDSAFSAFERAKDLTRQLTTFAKGGIPIKQPMRIERLLKEAVAFSLSGSNIRPNIMVDDSLWPAEIDEGQIHQVVSNIVINARQAMPAGGHIEVRASNCILGANDVPQLPQGQYIAVSVKDHGIGIPENCLDKVFEPFFTTKQQGSGLGLAQCFSIIKKHDGHITVASEVGEGSVFTFYLPAITRPLHATETKDAFTLLPGSGCILVMDDDELLRTLLSRTFESHGYQVLVARDGREAIELYRQALTDKKSIKAVILDMTIPGGMGGKETLAHLHDIDPLVKAIASTGYSDDLVSENTGGNGFSAVVMKPYHVNDLLRVVQSVIAG